MQNFTRGQRLTAMCRAFAVSAFISIEIFGIMFGAAYVLFEGVWMSIAYAFAGLLTLVSFIWVARRAYTVELEHAIEQKLGNDEHKLD